MKKRLKSGIYIICACIMLVSGYLYAGCRAYLDRQREILLTTERVRERDEIWFQKYGPVTWKYELTEEEQEFLREHVFGTWSFSRRMIALEEDCAEPVNFSGQGIEEIKENVVVEYGMSLAGLSGHTRNTFSATVDMYLFAAYGGMTTVENPVYHIENAVDADKLTLFRTYAADSVSYVAFPEERELVHVFYDLGYDEKENTSVDVHYAGDIYVDPLDAEVLYLDFGGLWELKRLKN
ncbi:MAG: hypothetical protein NC489_22490 [Ruminococcus flavefaciens]|nr:hypothetical protein [Ruminococcus flavefaciens]